jgi:hypothetical protein
MQKLTHITRKRMSIFRQDFPIDSRNIPADTAEREGGWTARDRGPARQKWRE